jgi:uncharacterized protein YneR
VQIRRKSMMNITVTDQAAQWFKEEMDLQEGDSIRFFARYGGSGPLHEGFSLGMNKEEPVDPAVTLEKDGCLYFIEERDAWYFQGHSLLVDYDEKSDGPVYRYE